MLHGSVGNRCQVGHRQVLPGRGEHLATSAAGFRVAGVADLAIVDEKNTAGVLHGLRCGWGNDLRYSMISLAMVVSADVKQLVIFPVIPASDFGFRVPPTAAGHANL